MRTISLTLYLHQFVKESTYISFISVLNILSKIEAYIEMFNALFRLESRVGGFSIILVRISIRLEVLSRVLLQFLFSDVGIDQSVSLTN